MIAEKNRTMIELLNNIYADLSSEHKLLRRNNYFELLEFLIDSKGNEDNRR